MGEEAGLGREATEVCEIISTMKDILANRRSNFISCASSMVVVFCGPCDKGALYGLGLKVAMMTIEGKLAICSLGKITQTYMVG